MPHAVLTGAIPEDGVASRLREIEETRTTGSLVFRHGETEGRVRLVQGQLAMEQPPREDGSDAVEMLLGLTAGEFEVLQELPPLPVSSGDDTKRVGSLEVHVAADLMNYCERAGLTGWLNLEHADGDRAEIGYARGELSGIRLQGPEELQEVFGWEEGRFEIEATAALDPFPEVEAIEDDEDEEPEERLDPTLPRAPKRRRRDDTAQHFLRVVEMTLAQIVEDREQHRPATRTGPPLPPMPAARDSVPAPPAKPKKVREPTIPIIYIDPSERAKKVGGLRHVKRGDSTAEVVLPEASPERRSQPRGRLDRSSRPPAKRKKRSMSDEKPKRAKTEPVAPEPKQLHSAVWAAIMLLVILLALLTLAALPGVD